MAPASGKKRKLSDATRSVAKAAPSAKAPKTTKGQRSGHRNQVQQNASEGAKALEVRLRQERREAGQLAKDDLLFYRREMRASERAELASSQRLRTNISGPERKSVERSKLAAMLGAHSCRQILKAYAGIYLDDADSDADAESDGGACRRGKGSRNKCNNGRSEHESGDDLGDEDEDLGASQARYGQPEMSCNMNPERAKRIAKYEVLDPSDDAFGSRTQFINLKKTVVSWVIGHKGSRIEQIRRESETSIVILDPPDTEGAWRRLRLRGRKENVVSAHYILMKLLGGEQAGIQEGERIDAAAKTHATSATQTHLDSSIFMPPAPHTVINRDPPSELALGITKSATAGATQSKCEQTSLRPAQKTPQISSQATSSNVQGSSPAQAATPRFWELPDDPTTKESSSDEAEADFQQRTPTPPPARKSRPKVTVKTPNRRKLAEAPVRAPTPPPAAPVFRVPDGATLIKLEDDGEKDKVIKIEEPSPNVASAPTVCSDTIGALQQAHEAGLIPVSGMISLAEFQDLLRRRKFKESKQKFRLTVLEYALHYVGVTDLQIERLVTQAGQRGEWDPKFKDVLHRERTGNREDGGALASSRRST